VQPGNPTINGNYIASLFVYRQPACQEWREIDLEVTGDSPNHLGTNLIIADNDCTFTSDKEQPQFFDVEGRDFRTTFQTIGFEWLPGAIRFYYLGDAGEVVQLREITGADVPALSTKIMANLWVFDDSFAFGGPEGENNQYPLRAEYESLRFYRWDQDTEYPCDDMSTACLKPEDLDMVGNNVCDGVPEIGDVGSCVQCGTTVRALCGETCE
jgi:beta-glucanase (GH16 family)